MVSLSMLTLSVGEFKARFSEIIELVAKGEQIAVTYGKKKMPVLSVVPYKKEELPKRKLGILEGKATFTMDEDFRITDENIFDL